MYMSTRSYETTIYNAIVLQWMISSDKMLDVEALYALV